MDIGTTTLEGHATVVKFTAAASGNLLTKGDKKIGFVDGEGVNQAGGYTIGPGDTTITNGQLQSQESALLRGLEVHVTRDGFDEIVPDVEAKAFLNAINLKLIIAGVEYKIGKAIRHIGPIQTNGNIPMIKAFPEPKALPGLSAITIEAEVNKTLTAGVVANESYVLWFYFPSVRAFQNEGAKKS